MAIYIAVKIQQLSAQKEAEDKFVMLTAAPIMIGNEWEDEIVTIGFSDARLIIPLEVTGALTIPIYACSSQSQILYAVATWLENATWAEIMAATPFILDNQKVMTLITSIVKEMTFRDFTNTIKPSPVFTVDQMYYMYVTRRWAIGPKSSPAWKKLFVSNINDSSNALINLAKLIIKNASHSEDGDNYANIYNDTENLTVREEVYKNNFNEFLDSLSTKPAVKPYVEQFLGWVNANYASLNEKSAIRVFNMCISITHEQNKPALQRPPLHKIITPEYVPLKKTIASNTIANLSFLLSIKRDDLFVEKICGLLTSDRYIFLLQTPRVMRELTRCMNSNPIYTNLIAYAMSFAMFYTTELEFVAKHHASESSPFVFTHNMVCEFPRFTNPLPYIPIGVKRVDLNIPFRVPGMRTPVPESDIPIRLNSVMVRDDSKFDIIKNIPWKKMGIILTGSRYASGCWIGPRERDLYHGNYKRYIREHFGTSELELDAIIASIDSDGEPLFDNIGRDFAADPSDQTPNKSPVSTKSFTQLSSTNPISGEQKTDVDAISASMLEFALTSVAYVGETKVSAAESSSATNEPSDELPLLVNEKVRDIFMSMKYCPNMFGNHTDIDIGFVGSQNEFDSAAAALVMHLRKFGKAVGLRFQKKRSYTWVIITSFLNYTIDFFHARDSALGLILNYMTSYPRAWFDGISHFCTADYICSRMTGINNRYMFTMNDPIYTMMKAAKREDITILLNYNEESMLRRWFEENMPESKLTFGNVSPMNIFFKPVVTINDGSIWSNKNAEDNEPKAWVLDPIVMPKSRTELTPWTSENAEPLKKGGGIIEPIFGKKINVANPTIFSSYMKEVRDLAEENYVSEIRLHIHGQ